ncbi:MAG: VanZ family protein [Saprospiraceae bacterium]|nr:VanZ family protein [Saprospiraceae bacterium]
MLEKIKNTWPAWVWLVAITYLSTQGGISVPKFDLLASDKLGHAAAYCLLVWLLLYGLSRSMPLTLGLGLGAVVFAAGYGMLMEYVQFAFFPARRFEYDDMLANTLGALIGWLVFTRLTHRQRLA